MMLNPDELVELQFTFRCKIATYNTQSIMEYQMELGRHLEDRVKSYISQQGVVSGYESRLERL